MNISFRPMLGLTILTVILSVILLGLGTWQYQRLQWKRAWLAEIEQAVQAPPLSGLDSVRKALADGVPVDFRRISFQGQNIDIGRPFLVFTPQDGAIGWRVYNPVRQYNNASVFVAQNIVPDTMRDQYQGGLNGALDVVGYVRLAPSAGSAYTKSSPEQNRWFSFNPLPKTHSWSEGLEHHDIDMRFYIDSIADIHHVDIGDVRALPVRRPDIRNNHLDYMLTWYGLALVLWAVYIAFHMREGRLSWR